MTPHNATALVEAREVSVDFKVSARDWRGKSVTLRAVDRVSLEIATGETLALVGESGCGKSTLGRVLLRLIEPTDGQVFFEGVDLSTISRRQRLELTRAAQIIFQDPYSSLNPRMKVEQIIAEPLRAHSVGSRRDRKRRVQQLLDLVGLPPSSSDRFPQAFSGGQRQRIAIARALTLEPRFIVADEPLSALDVSIQAEIVNLLKELQRNFKLAFLFISHDLAVVRHISHRVSVMYLGQIVETAQTEELFQSPLHPYTRALLEAIPVPDPDTERRRKIVVLGGEVPSPVHPPPGCRFHTRCPVAIPICRTDEPPLIDVGGGRLVACHLVPPAVQPKVELTSRSPSTSVRSRMFASDVPRLESGRLSTEGKESHRAGCPKARTG